MERDSNIITVLLLLLFQINIHSFIHSFIHTFIQTKATWGKRTCPRFETASVGLKERADQKTQFIDFKFGQDNGQGREPVKILGEERQRVHRFKYLGASVEETGGMTTESLQSE